MADDQRYSVDIARDDPKNLSEVLHHIGTRPYHVGIVSVTWQPSRTSEGGATLPAGYTIISEKAV